MSHCLWLQLRMQFCAEHFSSVFRFWGLTLNINEEKQKFSNIVKCESGQWEEEVLLSPTDYPRASPRCLLQSQNSKTSQFLDAENNGKGPKSQALSVAAPLQSLSDTVQGNQSVLWDCWRNHSHSKVKKQNRYMGISISVNKISPWDEKNHRTIQISHSELGLQRKDLSSLCKANLDPNCQVKLLIKQYLRRVIIKIRISLQTAPMTSRMSSLNAMCFQYVFLCLDISHSLNYKISPVKNCRVEVIRSNYSMHSFPITTLKQDHKYCSFKWCTSALQFCSRKSTANSPGKDSSRGKRKKPFPLPFPGSGS